MANASIPVKENENKSQKGVKLSLVENVSEIPCKKVTYKGRDFEVEELIKTINKLFYQKEGFPVSTREIAESLVS